MRLTSRLPPLRGFRCMRQISSPQVSASDRLYEGVLDSGVLFVAGPAIVVPWHGLGGPGIRLKAVIGPFGGVSGGVLNLHFQSHRVGLWGGPLG